MDLHAWITQQVDRAERLIDKNGPPTQVKKLRLRVEADRRILARHRLAVEDEWAWIRDPACHGCGTYGDCDDPNVDNLNDCPELLDLGHAHGLTDEILAGLDRPQPPERQPRTGPRIGHWLATPPITASDVPAALRGPRWKP